MARKFRFSLQAVLEHRERLQKDAQLALGRELGLLTQKQQDVVRIRQERQDLESKRPSQGSAEVIMQHMHWMHHLSRKIDAAEKAVQKQQKVVEQQREVLVNRTQDFRAMEILRDKHRALYHKQRLKDEMKATDESGAAMVQRKKRQEAA